MPSHPSAADSAPRGSSSDGRLLARARGGSRSAVDVLFARYGSWLRRWARGRLPSWARGTVDTSDLVTASGADGSTATQRFTATVLASTASRPNQFLELRRRIETLRRREGRR